MTALTHDGVSWSELIRGRNGLYALALNGGVCLQATNGYITTTMMPSIVAEIGGRNLYAWSNTLFLLMAVMAAAATGLMLQRLGPKQCYMLSGGLFAFGSAVVAFAPSMEVLLIGRALQGTGGGMVFSLCYALITHLFDERLWPRAMAVISAVYGVALLIGPAIGGFFAELTSWRVGFGVISPLMLVYVIYVLMVLPKIHIDQREEMKIPFAQLTVLALGVMALSIGGAVKDATWNVAGLAIAGLCLPLLARLERTRAVRLFPAATFQFGSPLCLIFVTVALMIMCVSSDLFLPFYLQHLHDQTPLMAGYMAALSSLGWTVAEIYSARFAGRTQFQAIQAGPVLIALGMAGLVIAFTMGTGDLTVILLIVGSAMFVSGAGIGVGWPHLTAHALKVSQGEDQERAGAALSTVQMVAMAFGSALAGMVANATGFNSAENLFAVAQSAQWLFATFALVGVIAYFSARRANMSLS